MLVDVEVVINSRVLKLTIKYKAVDTVGMEGEVRIKIHLQTRLTGANYSAHLFGILVSEAMTGFHDLIL